MLNVCVKSFYFLISWIVILTNFAFSQSSFFSDNFDSYTAGQQLACQNPFDWTTWSTTPCSPVEDPNISNSQSNSGSNSVLIVQNNDLVKNHNSFNNGLCEINFQFYIPTGNAGYFNTLATFSPPSYEWAMQVFFNNSGSGTIDAGGQNAATFSYSQNSWQSVKVIADLVLDRGEFWLNDTLIHSWQWSKGVFGTTTIPLTVGGTDFFGNTASDKMYIDNFMANYYPKVVTTLLGGNWSSTSAWAGGIVPSSNQPVEILSTSTVTLDDNILRNAGTLVNGKLFCSSFILSGTGNFKISLDATLSIGSSEGISTSGATGNIQVSGLRLFDNAANYVFDGITTQYTGDGLPASIKSLTINNPAGIILSNSSSITNTLTFQTGNLSLNGNTLTLGTGKTSATKGTLIWTSGFLTGSGTFKRWFDKTNIVIGNSGGLFPFGSSNNNRNVWVAGKPSKEGTISVQYNDVVGGFSFSFSENGHTFISRTNMNWVLSTANGFKGNNLLLRIQGSGLPQPNFITDLNICRSNGIAGGSYSTPTGTVDDPQVNRSGLTEITLADTFFIASVDNVLPVELTSFSASIIGSSVTLTWRTATEVNNYGFEIQRKSNNKGQTSDNWEKIGFVNGNGNSNSPKQYSFNDDKITAEKYFYRLKQVDTDGKYEYSKEIEVDINTLVKFSLEQNFPNPFNPSTKIKYTIPSTPLSFGEGLGVRLLVYDILGNEVTTLVNEQQQPGTYEVEFNSNNHSSGSGNLSSGVYYYQLRVGGFVETKKMILAK